MKLTAREMIDAPQAAVWARLTDYDRFETMAAKHVALSRTRDGANPAWETDIEWRGAKRHLTVEVTDVQAPDVMQLHGAGSGLEAQILLTLAAAGPSRTTLEVEVTVVGRSIAGKAIVHGLKLGRKQIQEKFAGRVGAIAKTAARGLA